MQTARSTKTTALSTNACFRCPQCIVANNQYAGPPAGNDSDGDCLDRDKPEHTHV